MLQAAAQIELVRTTVWRGDADAWTIHLSNCRERRPGWHQVSCLNLHIGRGEVNCVCALRLSAEKPDVPFAVRGRVGQRPGVGVREERDRDTQPLPQLASQVRGDAT